MSVQFVGTRSSDDRRRRRLAVSADGSGAALSPEDTSRIERRGLSADSIVAVSAPWIPQALWRIWTGGILLIVGLVLVGLVTVSPLALRPEFEPLQSHLLAQSRPILVDYLQSVIWTGITAWALLIGWYRSRSQSDFGGRYRIWSWFALLTAVVGFCAGTDAHHALARIAVEFKVLPAAVGALIWQIPLLSAALPLSLIIDRDLRRSRMSLMLFRFTAVVLLAAAAAPLLARSQAGILWFAYASILLPLAGMGLLFLTLWLQSWYVAYYCPDPPAVEAGLPSLLGRLIRPLIWLLAGPVRLFRRRSAADEEEEAKPRRRRKKAEGEAAAAAPRRKRKATTKRVAKPRTRPRKVEGEDVESDELDVSASWNDESAAEETWAEEAQSGDEWAEQEADEEAATAPASQSRDADDEWSDDDDDRNFRVDGPPEDQLKGLSKKQRRELRKQWKDQQRSR